MVRDEQTQQYPDASYRRGDLTPPGTSAKMLDLSLLCALTDGIPQRRG